jgi:hypothetical protein
VEYIELSEIALPDERYTWKPLEATDVDEQVYGNSGSVYTEAIKEGERLYAEQTAEYDRAVSREPHTSEDDRAAIDALKRLLGRR